VFQEARSSSWNSHSERSACIASRRARAAQLTRNGALKKIGARQEGILRKSFLATASMVDQALWTVLDEDWRIKVSGAAANDHALVRLPAGRLAIRALFFRPAQRFLSFFNTRVTIGSTSGAIVISMPYGTSVTSQVISCPSRESDRAASADRPSARVAGAAENS